MNGAEHIEFYLRIIKAFTSAALVFSSEEFNTRKSKIPNLLSIYGNSYSLNKQKHMQKVVNNIYKTQLHSIPLNEQRVFTQFCRVYSLLYDNSVNKSTPLNPKSQIQFGPNKRRKIQQFYLLKQINRYSTKCKTWTILAQTANANIRRSMVLHLKKIYDEATYPIRTTERKKYGSRKLDWIVNKRGERKLWLV